MATEDLQNDVTEDEAEDQPTQAETAGERREDEAEEQDGRSPEELRAEAERLRKQLKETNRKAAADRKRLEEVDREKREKEESKLSETARMRRRLDESEASLRELRDENEKLRVELQNQRIDREIERAAIGQFEYPQAAARLVDRDRISVDPETGKIAGVKDALDRVLKDYPGMATARRGGGSPAAMRTRRPGAGDGAADPVLSLREHVLRTSNVEPM